MEQSTVRRTQIGREDSSTSLRRCPFAVSGLMLCGPTCPSIVYCFACMLQPNGVLVIAWHCLALQILYGLSAFSHKAIACMCRMSDRVASDSKSWQQLMYFSSPFSLGPLSCSLSLLFATHVCVYTNEAVGNHTRELLGCNQVKRPGRDPYTFPVS
jgi:hypothetical protein